MNLKPFTRFVATVMDSNSSFWKKIRKQWQARYLGFIWERFDTSSKGGGDWPALAQSTINRRRKGNSNSIQSQLSKRGKFNIGAASSVNRDMQSAGGRFAILANTGTLKNAIDPRFENPSGSLREEILYGVRVGYGGSAKHENTKGTIDALASYHQEGNGNLPQRKIIVDPPDNIVQLMIDDADRAVENAIKQNG